MNDTLTGLPEGASAVVEALGGEGEARRRLLDLGFTPGALVTCLFSAPSGDPRAYEVRGSVIALRREDAAQMTVRAGA